MRKLGERDVPARLTLAVPGWVAEALCAGGCVMAALVLRWVVNLFAPQAAAFAFVYPAALAATLIAGWRAGLLALALLELGVWYLIIPPTDSFGVLHAADVTALVVNGLSCLFIVGVAQAFRQATRNADIERAAKIEERDLLLRELNHRVKNNFQMVASLLDMQRRRAGDAATQAALADALRRVHSMAQAHANLYPAEGHVGAIDAAAYLADLCGNLADSLLLTGLVRLEHDLEALAMTHDRAVALGLVTNELVTNAAKHAFPGGRSGVIKVTLRRTDTGAQLVVGDDGVGLQSGAHVSQTGLGQRLLDAFTRQAGGALRQLEGPGTTFVLDIPR